MQHEWSTRADAAEEAVLTRHVRRLWALPGTSLAVVAWPPVRRERLFFTWHYWWQAHFLDCIVDAADRNPTPRRRRRITKIGRSHRIRNITGWTNHYYDDMAWLGLALERAQRLHHLDFRSAIGDLESQVFDAWAPESGGGIPWRTRSDFYNTPANGPAAILLARTGRLLRAQGMADWIDDTLRDPATGLILDGIRFPPGKPVPAGILDRAVYSYCQGVTLGMETELAVRLDEPRHRHRVHALVEAVDKHLTEDGVIVGGGGGDGGLFDGILARYLAQVAAQLPGDTEADQRARRLAAQLVVDSADAAWENRLQVEGQPLFGCDWARSARMPGYGNGISTFTGGTVHASDIAERDLSVQLGGWMLMEAAYVAAGTLERRGSRRFRA
ncbi:glycoside hydrolase family 76 protein [Rhodococcus sp. NPDC058532]|uniref:glycoside hydrolase family 76 protein n=1 Tax=Rhodococcus sp. NPDC058532 TaxID=3346540 RepID=UPI00364C8601